MIKLFNFKQFSLAYANEVKRLNVSYLFTLS